MNLQINLNPQEILGNWRAGYALDHHTNHHRISSRHTHTEIGQMVYQVKRKDRSKIQPIAEIAAKFVKEEFAVDGHPVLRSQGSPPVGSHGQKPEYYINAIVPMLPSETRDFQPVPKIAAQIGSLLNLPVRTDYLIKVKQTRPLKSLDLKSKREEIQEAFRVQSQDLKGRCVLLFDDIYDSGITLTEATKVLYEEGHVRHVLVLTLSQTWN